MVTRSVKKGSQRKTPAVKPVVQTKTTKTVTSPDKTDIYEVLDVHSKHLLQMDELLSSMQKELSAIKELVVEKKITQTQKPRTLAKRDPGTSWHVLIEPNREYTQKEIIGITKISQPTLSMAKARGHIVTRVPPGERGWVVLGSDLLTWDRGRAIHSEKRSTTAAKKTTKPKKVTPVKTAKASAVQVANPKTAAVIKKEAKVKAAPTPVKSVKAPVAVKKTVKKSSAPVGRPAKKVVASRAKSDDQNLIPDDIPDRINALTLKKKITQTEFGNAVDLPQKVIYEITTRKLKTISPETIQKITAALKKFESK